MPVVTKTLSRPAAPGRLLRDARSGGPRWMARLIAMAIGAVLMAAALPPVGWWWAIPVSVPCLVLGVRGSRAGRALVLGALAGAAFAVLSLGWLSSVGADALIGMTALFAVWWAAMLLAVSLTMHLRLWALLVPAVWVLQEWLRSMWPLGGFPWARVGVAAVDSPAAPLVPYLGVFGMTYVLVAAGTLVAAVLASAHRRGRWGVVGVVLTTGVALGILASSTSAAPADPASGQVLVAAVVQGGRQAGPDGDAQARAVLAAHAQQTRDLAFRATGQADLVVWPESSTDIDPATDSAVRASIVDAVAAVNAPVLVGAVTAAPTPLGGVRNQAIMWLPTSGPSAAYTKRILVPFGEYVPGRGLLGPWAGRFAHVARDFVSGDDPPVLSAGRARVGILICFEVAFDSAVRDAVLAGADVLAVPSNNATYTGSNQPLQQLAIARFRALETARSVLVASTTGVSAIVGPDGAVLDSIADGQAGWRQREVPVSTDVTWAVRLGGGLGVFLAVVGMLSVMTAAIRRRDQ